MKLDVHIGLKRQEVSHSKDSGVYRGGVLDLKARTMDRPRSRGHRSVQLFVGLCRRSLVVVVQEGRFPRSSTP